MQARLSATDLACRRGERLLFRGLSLDLHPGDALHITGANGIGKSSLIRILAGLMSAYAGNVTREGDIGLIDEKAALDPDLPLGKSLAFWEAIDGCRDPSGALAAMELSDLLEVPVRFLSTGQKKRAALAALLNRGVPIWLLDEPLNGLDASAREKLIALLQLHCEGGGIAVIASHSELPIEGLKVLALEDFVPELAE